ncbi:HNH endonuclease [Candidatus Desantisbacteria bacterium]|nr:HNH endonuclease [Candidatus Desantisbacteria bacterium]MBI4846308.1 HNH endonuclease [Candidatus Omnitrophota bacterium]
MGSLYLNRLSQKEREALIEKLFQSQKEICFICEKTIDLKLHKDALDIDHIVPTKLNGKDDPVNFALTHSSCNRSKQASDLNIARILNHFDELKNNISSENRGPNLDDILKSKSGSQYEIIFNKQNGKIKYSLPEIGNNQIFDLPVYIDALSGFEYFFTNLPIEYLYHDDKINPRSIGENISKLIHEFYLKRPQLHISLAWIDLNCPKTKVKVFDGQHKASAQILLGVKQLPVRIFINPNPDILLTTNTNAGTTLRQVAFDKSVQRHLGSALYLDRIDRYKTDCNLSNDNYNFSERDLLKYFKGESREMKRYILDAVRDSITHNPENKLKDYIDFGGRGKDRPLSYSTIEKTFYSFFIFQDVLETPINYRLEEGGNPRELEKEQILELMNLIAEEIFIGKFDGDIGTSQIESKIQKGENLPLPHIRAFRMSKEEILYNWLRYIEQIIKNYFIMQGKPIQESKLFQYKFPEPLWERIKIFIKNIANLPVWINKELSSTVFGGKQVNDYWQTIFETGKSSQGLQVLAEPIDLMKMIKD